MKILKMLTLSLGLVTLFIFNGCLIESVEQQSQVTTGGTFTSFLTISDMHAESNNPHKGILMVLVPDDWTFTSGTYQTTLGSGLMLLNTESPIYGDIDTIIPPPTGMKWVDLISDRGFLHPANFIMETRVNFRVGNLIGTFPIGYASTKNTIDMLKSINPENRDNGSAWTDTSMNHRVTITRASGIDEQISSVPTELSLTQNFPNPFNPSTRFQYSLKKSGDVKISIYDASGKEVNTLVNGYRTAGSYEINFYAENLPSGIYYYRIVTSGFTQTKKMLLLK